VVDHPLTFLPTESASSQATTRPHPPSATPTTSSKNTPNASNASAKNTKQFSVPSRKPPSASNKIPKFSTNSNTRSASSKKPSDSFPRLQRLAKAKKVSSSRIRKRERNLVQRVGWFGWCIMVWDIVKTCGDLQRKNSDRRDFFRKTRVGFPRGRFGRLRWVRGIVWVRIWRCWSRGLFWGWRVDNLNLMLRWMRRVWKILDEMGAFMQRIILFARVSRMWMGRNCIRSWLERRSRERECLVERGWWSGSHDWGRSEDMSRQRETEREEYGIEDKKRISVWIWSWSMRNCGEGCEVRS